MIIHDVKQYSPGWWARRLGIATASRFNSIITSKTMKPSEARTTLITDLLLERITGKPSDYKEGEEDTLYGFEKDGTPWMKRGADVEAEARVWYQMHTGRTIIEVGFVTTDDGLAGCSPDGLELGRLGIVRGLEIKGRSARIHLRYPLGFEEVVEMPQVQGSMWVTGADAWDVLAYCPGLPGRLFTSYRDPAWMLAFDAAWKMFRDEMEAAQERLDEIEEDVVEGNNLALVWTHAMQRKPSEPCPLSIDELDDLRVILFRLMERGEMAPEDFLKIVGLITDERWESVYADLKSLTATEDVHAEKLIDEMYGATKHRIDEMLMDLLAHPKSRAWADEAGAMEHDGNSVGLADLHEQVKEAWEMRT